MRNAREKKSMSLSIVKCFYEYYTTRKTTKITVKFAVFWRGNDFNFIATYAGNFSAYNYIKIFLYFLPISLLIYNSSTKTAFCSQFLHFNKSAYWTVSMSEILGHNWTVLRLNWLAVQYAIIYIQLYFFSSYEIRKKEKKE